MQSVLMASSFTKYCWNIMSPLRALHLRKVSDLLLFQIVWIVLRRKVFLSSWTYRVSLHHIHPNVFLWCSRLSSAKATFQELQFRYVNGWRILFWSCSTRFSGRCSCCFAPLLATLLTTRLKGVIFTNLVASIWRATSGLDDWVWLAFISSKWFTVPNRVRCKTFLFMSVQNRRFSRYLALARSEWLFTPGVDGYLCLRIPAG